MQMKTKIKRMIWKSLTAGERLYAYLDEDITATNAPEKIELNTFHSIEGETRYIYSNFSGLQESALRCYRLLWIDSLAKVSHNVKEVHLFLLVYKATRNLA